MANLTANHLGKVRTIVLFASYVCFFVPSESYGRQWTSADGKYSVEADFVALVGDSVKLRRPDGKEILVAISRLSNNDREYITKQASAQATGRTKDVTPSQRREDFVPLTFEEILAFNRAGINLKSLTIDKNTYMSPGTFALLQGYVPESDLFVTPIRICATLDTLAIAESGTLNTEAMSLLRSLNQGAIWLRLPSRNRNTSSIVALYGDGRTERFVSPAINLPQTSSLTPSLLKDIASLDKVKYLTIPGYFDSAVFGEYRIHLLGLDISGSGATDLRCLSYLPEIKYLRAEDNRKNDMKSDLSYLRSCKDLELLYMDFSPRDDFSVLSELKHLKAVRAHGLALPDSFLINAGANGTLEELCLSSPRFSRDAISTFVRMNKNISQLKWTDATSLATCMHEFSALTHMKNMSLYSSNLSDDGLIALKDMHDLVFLDMSNNSIHGDGLQHVTGCKMLRQLSLGKNHIKGQHLSYIAPLRSLEWLTLDYNPIDDDGVQYLADLNNLKLLGLRETNITDRCIPSLGRLSNLKSIYISRTLISESGIEKLCHMLQKVSIIGVSQKQLTAESVARLKDQFPKVYFQMEN